ncbi:MAG: integrase core domain-containing protein [Alphaproteobacteria bacterium]
MFTVFGPAIKPSHISQSLQITQLFSWRRWRRDYNTVRPHSALNYLTPAKFIAAQGAGEARLGVVASPTPCANHHAEL